MCMEFDDAQDFVMPLGKFKGKRLFEIAMNNDGLCYLDWLIGQDWVSGNLKSALESYLGDPLIAKEVEDALSEQDYRNDNHDR